MKKYFLLIISAALLSSCSNRSSVRDVTADSTDTTINANRVTVDDVPAYLPLGSFINAYQKGNDPNELEYASDTDKVHVTYRYQIVIASAK